MTLPSATLAQVAEAAEAIGLKLNHDDLPVYGKLMQQFIDSYDVVDQLVDQLPPWKYPRLSGRFPTPEENPCNAWYVKCDIKGASSGKLAGKRVAIKDNIMVAGVPMMNGSSILEGYIPDMDATVVARILDAGGEVAGKAQCENLCMSAGSHTGAKGPVLNPRNQGFSAGGSSSGSAALVALGEVDLALGCDQGGSLRVPSSWCGVVGMKPTYGLVPYTGIVPIEIYLDHVGPMTKTVMDNALLLEAIAGADGYDPRQQKPITHAYTQALDQDAKGMRVGVIKEGFGRPESEAASDVAVRAGVELMAKLGAKVEEVSIPEHMVAPAVWAPIGVEGVTQTMMFGDIFGQGRQDLYVTSLMDRMHGWPQRADDLSLVTQVVTMLGVHMKKYHGSRFYGKAVNLTRRIRAAYDSALNKYDVLVLPTTPMKATPLPPADASRELSFRRSLEMIGNTCAFDFTHHPALTVPCGRVDGLPIGMMIVGRHYDEPSLYRLGHAFEAAGGGIG